MIGAGHDAQPARVQRRQRDGEPVPLLADEVIGGHPGAIEDHLGGDRGTHPHLALGRARADAGRAGRNVEAADAARPLRPGRLSRGAGEQGVEVGLARVADPGLDAVDPVAAVVGRGPGGQRRGVRAALWLGQAVGAEQLAAEQAGQPPLLLLRRARGGQRETGQRVHAHAQADGHPRPRQLLNDLQVDLVRLAAAAPSLRVGQAQQPRPAQQAERLAREGPGPLGRAGRGLQLLDGQLVGEVKQFLHHAAAIARVTIYRSTITISRVALLSRSPPSGVHTTMSSMRAPCGPG
jgi:hypothetical protein